MIGETIKLLIDVAAYIWPFRIVKQWERAGYLVFGRWQWDIGPGLYPVVPWFCEVVEISMAEAVVPTERLDITIQSGGMLSFSAKATVQVVDPEKALLEIDDFKETVQETLGAVLADRLSKIDAPRLDPENRGRLAAAARDWVANELEPYGIAVKRVRFASFVLNAKPYRLLVDTLPKAEW